MSLFTHRQPRRSERMPKWKTLPRDTEATVAMPAPVKDLLTELAEVQGVSLDDIALDALQAGLRAVTEEIRKAAEPRPQPYGPTKGDSAKIEAVNEIEAKADARLKAAQYEKKTTQAPTADETPTVKVKKIAKKTMPEY